jgi:MoaA/NifB/PqqE/SkfB family radical SAM enzyme
VNLITKLKSRLGWDATEINAHLASSDVFCMAPWIQLHAQTDGKIGPCCRSSMTDGKELGDLKDNPKLSDAWNSEKMKQLRLNMVKGDQSPICSNCYQYEKLGKFSERMQYNKDFKNYYSRVTHMLRDGTVPENKIPIIDIRFSNKCNYKCRICNSNYSSLWYEEELKLGKPDPGRPKEMKAADEAIFWESFKSLLPYVERLHFAGGEPLFMDEHYEVLQHLISIGKTDINLTYNTNFSTLRYKKHNLIELWNQFKRVDIWASLDGMGEQGDYHRKGQKWEEVEQNIRTLKAECHTAIFGVNVTISIFNILHIPTFYQYMVEQGLVAPDRMNLYLLFSPEYFSITNLPRSIKNKAVKQFEEMKTGYLNTLADSDRMRDHIKSVVNLMLSKDDGRLSELRQAITEVDAIRNEKFMTTFPELAELIVSEKVLD